tara:strand:- start:242 stop:616 length:375 start_codon:yes stop_codon:yes gene_type:complete
LIKNTAKTVYHYKEFSDPELKHRNDMAMLILEDYVLMIDVCNWVNKLINTSNTRKDAFWGVENKINGIQTLFHIGGIVRVDHQQILEDIVYSIAVNAIDEDKNERALKIKAAFLEKLLILRDDL